MAPTYNLKNVTMDYPFMTCIVNVNTRSSGHKTVAKVLEKCHGVYSFRMDEDGLVQVSGTVDPAVLLKMLGKAGKNAELRWFQFGQCSNNLFMPSTGGYGRYLQPENYPCPKIPLHDAFRSSAYNQKQDYHIAYDHDQQYAYGHNYNYQQPYNYGYAYDNRHEVNQTRYRAPLSNRCDEDDFGCCTIM